MPLISYVSLLFNFPMLNCFCSVYFTPHFQDGSDCRWCVHRSRYITFNRISHTSNCLHPVQFFVWVPYAFTSASNKLGNSDRSSLLVNWDGSWKFVLPVVYLVNSVLSTIIFWLSQLSQWCRCSSYCRRYCSTTRKKRKNEKEKTRKRKRKKEPKTDK